MSAVLSAHQASVVESRANRIHSSNAISKGDLNRLAYAALSDPFDDMQEAAELDVLRNSGRFGDRYLDSDSAW